ncbi:hypothetical protein V1514DRAFT_323622 [Lipomyces japonicus]|uniref:uncharacterized protein n=1 Tax=Lipomyces japonicus TaxID=56871 RepID=UPI0034CFE8B1
MTQAGATALSSRPVLVTTASTQPLVEVCADIASRVDVFLSGNNDDEGDDDDARLLRARTQERVRASLAVTQEALTRYSNDELAISFNGGKDCLVMLVLLLASIYYKSTTVTATARRFMPQRIHTVYVHSDNAFAEVDRFVNACTAVYSLDLIRLPGPIKQAFERFLHAKPHVRAIMVGTRRTDPNGHDLAGFNPTDHGWPEFMRVHPVVDWTYAEVWHFLRALNVPYLNLYDQGYTSLGGVTDTHKNPALADGSGGFRPAYELADDDKERLGRYK